MILKIVLALVAVPVLAFANIGDTRTESANRYGKPYLVKGNVQFYHVKGWMITEWFNSSGYAELISYNKSNGNVTERENKAFCWVNLPAGMNPSDWLELDSVSKSSRCWQSLDQRWYYESSLVKIGKYWFDTVTIGTTNGIARLVNDGKNGNDSDSTANTLTNDSNPLPI